MRRWLAVVIVALVLGLPAPAWAAAIRYEGRQ